MTVYCTATDIPIYTRDRSSILTRTRTASQYIIQSHNMCSRMYYTYKLHENKMIDDCIYSLSARVVM